MPNNNTITQEHIDSLFKQSEIQLWAVHDKTLVMAVKLPNGFVIVKDASCVDPKNFDIEIGKTICTERVKNQMWELEGYRLQDEIKTR